MFPIILVTFPEKLIFAKTFFRRVVIKMIYRRMTALYSCSQCASRSQSMCAEISRNLDGSHARTRCCRAVDISKPF